MAVHDMTSDDFYTRYTQNTYTHNKHRVRMRPPKGHGMAGDVTSVRQFGSILR